MILIVGADGFIGGNLFRYFKKAGWDVKGTSLAKKPPKGLLYFDITKPSRQVLEVATQSEYIVVAVQRGGIDDCANDKKGTGAVNVVAVKKFLSALDPKKNKPVYLSSNMVFAGRKKHYVEEDRLSPTTEYGRQKVQVENFIRKRFPRHIMVRLTKVYGLKLTDNTLFSAWVKAARAGKQITATTDMLIAPVWVDDVARALAYLMKNAQYGTWHIPGPVMASPYDLVKDYAKAVVLEKKRADFDFVEARPKYQTLSGEKLRTAFFPDLLTPKEAFARLQGE